MWSVLEIVQWPEVLTLRTILSAAVELLGGFTRVSFFERVCNFSSLKTRLLDKICRPIAGPSPQLRLGLLVSQDADIDGSISAKPFIDNMIHVISEPGPHVEHRGTSGIYIVILIKNPGNKLPNQGA